MNQLVAGLESKLDELRLNGLRNVLLTRDDLIEALSPIRNIGLGVVVVVRDKSKLIQNMSLAWDERYPILAEDRRSFAESARRVALSGTRHQGEYAEVDVSGQDAPLGRIASLVADIADVVFSNSLSAQNIARDRRAKLLERLRRMLDDEESQNRNQFDLASLADFLMSGLNLHIDVVVFDEGARTSQMQKRSTARPSASVPTNRLGGTLRPFDRKQDPDPTLRFLLTMPDPSQKIREAILAGKPFDLTFCSGSSFEEDGDGPKVSANTLEFRSLHAAVRQKAVVIPIRSYVDPGMKRLEAFVVRSIGGDRRIRHESIDAINRCLDLFITRKYRVGQTKALALLMQKLEGALRAPPLVGYRDLDKRLRNALQAIARTAVASTAAYSMAVLEHDPQNGSLRRFFLYEHPSAKVRRQINRRSGAPSASGAIRLVQFRERLSAFAFRHANQFPSFYVKDAKNIPEEFAELGLGSIRTMRDSGSEIAIPIRRGNLVLGVVNFEARNRYAFDSDVPFLEAVVSGFSSMITSYYQSSDTMWLLDNVNGLESFHELRRRVEDIALKLKELPNVSECSDMEPVMRLREVGADVEASLGELNQILERGTIGPRVPKVSLKTTLASVSSYVSQEFNPKFYRNLSSDVDLKVTKMRASAIRIILKNICRNVEYGNQNRDRLSVRVLAPDDHNKCYRLRIWAHFYNWQDTKSQIDAAFIAPVRTADGLRHGLHIIGVVTRAMRGKLSFTRKLEIKRAAVDRPALAPLRLDILLPLD